jgi:hypothetical protein
VAGAGFVFTVVLLGLALGVLLIASFWKVLTKAGEDGWKALIPIYNTWVLNTVAGRPGWWALLGLVPVIGFVLAIGVTIVVSLDLAKSFGKDTGFAIGLMLLPFVFYPILAFGDARYLGPAGPQPRQGWVRIGQGGGYGQAGGFGQGYQPPAGQDWGQPPQSPPAGQGWGQQPAGQGWGQQPQPPSGGQDWGQPPQSPPAG